MNHLEYGAAGENLGAEYLQGLGWTIVARNVRIGRGELDIIALDGEELVFVEVRTRRIGRIQSPGESVGPKKRETLKRAAAAYVEKYRFSGNWRIDVLAITEREPGEFAVELIGDCTPSVEVTCRKMGSISGVTLKGTQALPVEVEVEITGGLFSITVVGLPDTAVKEARERIRAALRGIGLTLKGRITINLAPADLPKEGALLDLPMAIGLAYASGRIGEPASALYMGELALNGRLRWVRGAVPAAILARDTGIPLFVPRENEREVALVSGVQAYAVDTLLDLVLHLTGEQMLPEVVNRTFEDEAFVVDTDFADIKGQFAAKRALEIAAAGHHNLLMTGSPGSGKTLLARALKGILPPLSDEEMMEVLVVRSTAGLPLESGRARPFRTAHHTASAIAICGGGSALRPGEVTLANRGVLFLDEFPEFSRDVLEALRQPLEDAAITVSRASGSVTYPARVLLVTACNPCPCGFSGDPEEKCQCPPAALERYQRKLSGPILDRIDLHVSVPRLSPEELVSLGESVAESSEAVRNRVRIARERQHERWRDLGYQCNAELPEKVLRTRLEMEADVKSFLTETVKSLRLSGRGFSRILRVARTVADLDGSEKIAVHHVAESMSYREGAAFGNETGWRR